MSKEPNIKVEAELTTKKNVSSGIGKGFGIIIGIFLGLIVIAVSCSVLLSSQADEIEKKSNEITANAIRENERELQEIQQQIDTRMQKAIDDSLTADEKTKEQTKSFEFNKNAIVNSKNGISLSLDDLNYEIKGDNWGKITEITVTILNNGNNDFKPEILVFLYDEKDRKEEWFQTKAKIEFDIWNLQVGEHITKKAIVNIPFDDLNLTKKFELALLEGFQFDNKPIVVVEKDFVAEAK